MKTIFPALGAATAAAILSGCGDAPAAPAPAQLPPAQVAEVVVRNIEVISTHTARVEAAQRVELRPRVAGTIQEVAFREGDVVAAGKTLFRIDPRPFDAALRAASAELATAEARLVLARAEASRAERLAAANAISVEEGERRRAAFLEAQARVDASRAALDAARLDREFCEVKAPISGRIGRILATPGNVVAAGIQQTPLATLVSTDPLHLYLDVNDGPLAAQIVALRRQGSNRLSHWKARVLAAEGERSLAEGPIDFADNEVAAGTGTLRLRATVSGASALMPGMFARVQLVTGERREAVLIDERAVGADQGQRFVLVAKPDNVLEYRPVKLGAHSQGLRTVESGLAAGETIVVNGLMKLRPGARIQPQPVAMENRPASRADAGKDGKSAGES